MSPAESNSSKTGWVYLGRYDGGWKTQYFEFPSDKTPTELEKNKLVIHVKANPGAANFRLELPDHGTKPDGQSVVGIVHKQDNLQIDRVEAVPGTAFMWAHVVLLPRQDAVAKASR